MTNHQLYLLKLMSIYTSTVSDVVAVFTATSIGSPDKNVSVVKLASATSTGEDSISFIRGFAWPGKLAVTRATVSSKLVTSCSYFYAFLFLQFLLLFK